MYMQLNTHDFKHLFENLIIIVYQLLTFYQLVITFKRPRLIYDTPKSRRLYAMHNFVITFIYYKSLIWFVVLSLDILYYMQKCSKYPMQSSFLVFLWHLRCSSFQRSVLCFNLFCLSFFCICAQCLLIDISFRFL